MNNLFDELNIATRNIEQTLSSHQNKTNALHHDYGEQIAAVREDASRVIAKLVTYTGNHLKISHADFEEKLKKEIHQLEMQNEDEIKTVIGKNRQDMQQMRKLANASINSNLDTITALTKELVTLREQHRKDMTVLRELQVENAGIMTPLETSSSDLQQLDADLDAFYKQKKDLQTRRQQLRQAEEELSDIKWDHEVLFQEYERLEQECKERKKSYQEALYAAQQKSNMKNLRLEQKLAAKTLRGEQAQAVLSQIMLKSNVNLDMIDNSIVSDIVAEKTNRVKVLKDAHSAMMKRHGGLIEDGR